MALGAVLGGIGAVLGGLGSFTGGGGGVAYPTMSAEEKDLLKKQADILGIGYDQLLAFAQGQKEIGLQTMAEETGVPMGAMGGTYGGGYEAYAPGTAPGGQTTPSPYGVTPEMFGPNAQRLLSQMAPEDQLQRYAFMLSQPEFFGKGSAFDIAPDIGVTRDPTSGQYEWSAAGLMDPTRQQHAFSPEAETEFQKYQGYLSDPQQAAGGVGPLPTGVPGGTSAYGGASGIGLPAGPGGVQALQGGGGGGLPTKEGLIKLRADLERMGINLSEEQIMSQLALLPGQTGLMGEQIGAQRELLPLQTGYQKSQLGLGEEQIGAARELLPLQTGLQREQIGTEMQRLPLLAGAREQAYGRASELGTAYDLAPEFKEGATALETYLQKRGALRGRGSGYAGEVFGKQFADIALKGTQRRRGEIGQYLGLVG